MENKWVDELFRAIDSMDIEKFAGFLADNAVFRFGNADAVHGREEIKKSVSQFFSIIKALSHKITMVWEHNGNVMCHGEVTYTRKDSSKVTLPFANIFYMDKSLISKYLIYIDIGPLFNP
ncbi:nuclear transport factor 2 family protein [Candidatus Woesearchaeota archaeon]|nr:nuclear transport factor 2 family protein [Candidatus Woesearchaeota archaeon]